MTSNLKVAQNGQHSSPNFLGLGQRNPTQSQLGGIALDCPGEVVFDISRVTGADAVPSGTGCTPYIGRTMLLWATEVRAMASRHKWPRNADLVFTRLRSEGRANLSPHDQGYQR